MVLLVRNRLLMCRLVGGVVGLLVWVVLLVVSVLKLLWLLVFCW